MSRLGGGSHRPASASVHRGRVAGGRLPWSQQQFASGSAGRERKTRPATWKRSERRRKRFLEKPVGSRRPGRDAARWWSCPASQTARPRPSSPRLPARQPCPPPGSAWQPPPPPVSGRTNAGPVSPAGGGGCAEAVAVEQSRREEERREEEGERLRWRREDRAEKTEKVGWEERGEKTEQERRQSSRAEKTEKVRREEGRVKESREGEPKRERHRSCRASTGPRQ